MNNPGEQHQTPGALKREESLSHDRYSLITNKTESKGEDYSTADDKEEDFEDCESTAFSPKSSAVSFDISGNTYTKSIPKTDNIEKRDVYH